MARLTLSKCTEGRRIRVSSKSSCDYGQKGVIMYEPWERAHGPRYAHRATFTMVRAKLDDGGLEEYFRVQQLSEE